MSVAQQRPIGILGGTFDPVHYGHLALAEQAREDLGLAYVLFVPAGIPPHKSVQAVTPAQHREAMVRLAIHDHPDFRLSRMELERPGPSFAVDTVASVAADSRSDGRPEPVFILSSEALEGLDTWRDPARILGLCRIAVAPRPGSAGPGPAWIAESFPGREDRFTFLTGPLLGHAATDIRERVRSGRSVRYLVPPEVERYIDEHRLYRDAAGGSDASETRRTQT